MSTELTADLNSEPANQDFVSISSWTKFISIIYFSISSILFIVSFLPFIIKRTYGVDNRLVSGALPGSLQLFFFVTGMIFALIFFLLGSNLLKFSQKVRLAELNDVNSSILPAIKNLKKYFVMLGLFTFVIFFAAVIALLIGITI